VWRTPPGGTVQFARGPSAPFSADQYLLPVSSFTKGAAKIWSDAKKLQCGAILVNTQTSGWASLPVIAKKQKGD